MLYIYHFQPILQQKHIASGAAWTSSLTVWIDFMRRIIHKVVIEPSADGKSADVAIHGYLAATLAAQEVSLELREPPSGARSSAGNR